MKICIICGDPKQPSEFSKHKENKDGFSHKCKQCTNTYRRARRAKFGTKKRTTKQQKQHNEANKKWMRNTVRGFMTYIVSRSRNSAKRKGREHNITVDDLLNLWSKQSGCCALTGIPMVYSAPPLSRTIPSLDRINNELGYIKGNVRLVLYVINVMRNDLSDQEFFQYCSIINKRHV